MKRKTVVGSRETSQLAAPTSRDEVLAFLDTAASLAEVEPTILHFKTALAKGSVDLPLLMAAAACLRRLVQDHPRASIPILVNTGAIETIADSARNSKLGGNAKEVLTQCIETIQLAALRYLQEAGFHDVQLSVAVGLLCLHPKPTLDTLDRLLASNDVRVEFASLPMPVRAAVISRAFKLMPVSACRILCAHVDINFERFDAAKWVKLVATALTEDSYNLELLFGSARFVGKAWTNPKCQKAIVQENLLVLLGQKRDALVAARCFPVASWLETLIGHCCEEKTSLPKKITKKKK